MLRTFGGPFNFSVGGNYLHYETEENYYVFINTLTMAAYNWAQGTTGVRHAIVTLGTLAFRTIPIACQAVFECRSEQS